MFFFEEESEDLWANKKTESSLARLYVSHQDAAAGRKAASAATPTQDVPQPSAAVEPDALPATLDVPQLMSSLKN